MRYVRDGYVIDTDGERLESPTIHAYLSRSYWAEHRSLAVVEKSLKHSLNFGLYDQSQVKPHQVGLARVITDYATFAYLCDVYILETHQGKGLGKWLMETVTSHPELSSLRRFMLITRDAHGLYRQYGFKDLASPERWMEIYRA
ncbi:MAG: GNAT family N-acetyltransferase [Deinococcales bacterium]